MRNKKIFISNVRILWILMLVFLDAREEYVQNNGTKRRYRLEIFKPIFQSFRLVKIFIIVKFVEQWFRLPLWLAVNHGHCERLMGAVVVSLATFQPSTDVQQRPWAPHEGRFG